MNEESSGRQPHHVDRHVGSLIRAKRKALRMSQEELAAALGLTFQQIQKYERGTNRVSSSKLYEIAQKLDTPLPAFFEGLDGSTGAAGATGEITRFLGERGAHELITAFLTMEPAVRASLVDLARAMSDTD